MSEPPRVVDASVHVPHCNPACTRESHWLDNQVLPHVHPAWQGAWCAACIAPELERLEREWDPE